MIRSVSRLLLAAVLLSSRAGAAALADDEKRESAERREREERREQEERREREERREALGRDGGAAPESAKDRASADETLYAMGAILGRKVSGFDFRGKELETIKRGFADALSNKPLKLKEADLEEWGPRVDRFLGKRKNPKLAAEHERGKALADAAAKEPGAVRTPSGLVFRTLTPGTGPSPSASDKVKVNYEGRLPDGTVFDASAQHGGPAEFPLGGVIPCWTEGVQRMKVGEKARFVCPSTIAYGDPGRPPQIPGGSTLTFEVELLGVQK